MISITPKLLIELYRQPEKAQELTPQQWQSIILILRHHHLLARFQFLFEKVNVLSQLPDFAQRHLMNARQLSSKQYHQIFFEAEKLVNSVALRSEPVVFLKGAAYTLSKLQAGIGRVYSDIDILLEKESITQVERSLFSSGWMPQPITAYDDAYYRNWTHEIPPLQHGVRGTVLDVHHNLIPVISGRSPDMKHFFQHTVRTPEGITTLTPAGMTLHSLIHLFFNEDFTNGFRDLLDLDLLISEHDCDDFWSELVELAEKTGFQFEFSLALRYLDKLLGTRIPAHIQEAYSLRTGLKLKWLDYIFQTVLLPSHPLVNQSHYATSEFLAFIRGHYIKMPTLVLMYHLTYKGARGLIKSLFGKTFFDEEEKKHKF